MPAIATAKKAVVKRADGRRQDSKPTEYGHTGMARFLRRRFDQLAKEGVNQSDVARALGYKAPHIISMMKVGETKVPLHQIPALAAAIGADPLHLFRLAVEQYWPNDTGFTKTVFANTVSKNEMAVVHAWRAATDGMDPNVGYDLVNIENHIARYVDPRRAELGLMSVEERRRQDEADAERELAEAGVPGPKLIEHQPSEASAA